MQEIRISRKPTAHVLPFAGFI